MENSEKNVKCPVCGQEFKNLNGLYGHLTRSKRGESEENKKHDFYYRLNKELLDDVFLHKKDPSFSVELPNFNIGEFMAHETESMEKIEEENVSTQKTTPTTYDSLREILVNVLGSRFKNIDGIVWTFQYYKPNDIKKLKQLLQESAVPDGKISTIIELYEKMVRPTTDEEEELTEEEEKKQKQEKKQTEAVKSLDETLSSYEETLMKEIEKQIKLRQLIAQAKRLGIDLSGLGIDVPTVEDEDPIDEYEFPPGSGKFIKLRASKYAELIAKYQGAHKEQTVLWTNPYTGQVIEVPMSEYSKYLSITKEFEEKHKKAEAEEDTVPWKNPYSGEIIQVPRSQLHAYLAITAEKEKEDKEKDESQKFELMKAELAKQLEDLKKKNDELSRILDQKEKEDLYGYINSLKNELEKVKNKDELSEIAKLKDKLTNVMESFGMKPGEQSVRDKVELEEVHLKAEALNKGLETLSKKIEEMGSKTSKVLEILAPLIQDEAKFRLDQRRLRQLQAEQQGLVPREVQRSEEELANVLKNLESSSNSKSI